MDQRRLEILAVLDQLGAESAHRGVLLRAVAVGDHDDGAQSVPPGGEGHRLAVVAARGGDDRAHRGIAPDEPAEVGETSPDLEGAEQSVVLLLHPELAAGPRVQERPAVLRRRRDHRVDFLGEGLDLGQGGERIHGDGGAKASRGSSRHCPGASSPRSRWPKRVRCRVSTSQPWLENIRRTWW